jgi:RNA polymerase sigma-70 factor (ECF subfamily)
MSMKLIPDVPPRKLEDKELVARSRTGDVGAFRGIAMRYYSLIYTMAYEATGSSNQSDDLARDTFLAAWRRLSDSREPIKLRSWLCALARELTDDYLRRRAGIRSENQMGNSDYK